MADDPHILPADDSQGSDWEDAFQADEFVLSPTEQADSTLLDGAATEGGDVSVPAGRKRERSVGKNLLASLVGNKLALAAAGVAVVVLLVAGGFFLLRRPAPTPGPDETAEGRPAVPVAGERAERPAEVGPPEEPSPGEVTAPASQPAISLGGEDRPLELPPPVETPPDRQRRKIRLSGFMIDVADDHSAGPRYVAVDCSLVVRLEPEEEFPLARRYMVRDAIYQFYANRPYYELKRYALARGEMKRKLLAWLRKEWPDAPIETIIFHRYRLL